MVAAPADSARVGAAKTGAATADSETTSSAAHRRTALLGSVTRRRVQSTVFNVQPAGALRFPGLSRFNNPRSELVPRFQARVLVQLRPSVLDPAGEATNAAAQRLGVEGISHLRIGKAVELEVDAPDEAEARRRVELLSDRLLANPVIENWTLELLQS